MPERLAPGSGSRRARLLAVLATAALVVAGVGATQPAHAADGNVGVGVLLASTDFFGPADGEELPPGVIEVFDATGDGSEPLMTVDIGPMFLFEYTWLDLPDGSYRIRATVEGYLPTWAGWVADGGAEATDEPGRLGGLIDAYHPFAPVRGFSDAPVLEVEVGDESFEQPAYVNVLAARSAAFLGGVVFNEQQSAAESATVELYRIGQGAPARTTTVERGQYVFDDVAQGNYQVRFVSEGVEQWWPYEATRSRADILNVPSTGGGWVAIDATFAPPETTAPGERLAIEGDPVEGGLLSLAPDLADPFDIPGLNDTRIGHITWYLDGEPIPGAVRPTLVVPPDAVGGEITATAEAVQMLGYFRTRIEALPVGPVSPATDPEISPAPTPQVLGSPTVGERLDTTLGSWATGTTRTFQWFRDGEPIEGATNRGYVPKGTDLGGELTFVVTGVLDGHRTTVRASGATAPVAEGAFATPSAVLKTDRMAAEPRVGDRMRAVHGAWSPAAEAWTYQWHRDGVPIDGATGEYYTVGADDLGARLSAEITGSRLGYTAATAVSVPSGPVTEGVFRADRPVIVPAPQVGVELSVDLGVWTPEPDVLTIQWMRGTTVLATGPSYTPVPGDAGRNLRVVVTGEKVGYTTAQRASLAVAVLP
ncbi:hypothetical protein AVP42_01578 [Agromyces sp. NDB4Y10]|uniref:carboxypeptidase regulatory-like domain-containing protein n=1 Tax=Agromyces sp. NDB4Y10 TaxID=1775951 RepID=UPI0007B2169E|nr:carboxypeptidase regulatory-like domain-containing protein [Agromyces sp. NDB4Y10]KZE93958.1 hypothetical protein AVP42_01578 [Agromyces sp. NDB4Y10]